MDIVVLNLDFTDLCGFYIPCGVGEKRGGRGVQNCLSFTVLQCLGGWGWGSFIHFLALFKVEKMQLYNLEDEWFIILSTIFIQ